MQPPPRLLKSAADRGSTGGASSGDPLPAQTVRRLTVQRVGSLPLLLRRSLTERERRGRDGSLGHRSLVPVVPVPVGEMRRVRVGQRSRDGPHSRDTRQRPQATRACHRVVASRNAQHIVRICEEKGDGVRMRAGLGRDCPNCGRKPKCVLVNASVVGEWVGRWEFDCLARGGTRETLWVGPCRAVAEKAA